jgi:hypothetical protein
MNLPDKSGSLKEELAGTGRQALRRMRIAVSGEIWYAERAVTRWLAATGRPVDRNYL